MYRRFALWLCVLVACHGVGCTKARPNIVVVVIDTLRPDRLGAYGNSRGLTPFLDSLAARGVVFRNAYAQTSWTNASIASLFTSRYQSQHHVTSFQAALSDQEQTLGEVLKANGYATGGFVANILLLSRLGFAQGFDEYKAFTRTEKDFLGRDLYIKERAQKINSEALHWLDQREKAADKSAPVFLYLHYMEPHNPYDPPAATLERLLAGRPKPDIAAVNDRMRLPNIGTFTDELVRDVQDLYDAEVSSVDADIRVLFDELGRRKILDDCIVVITADHGEEFREHGLMGHHQTLFEEVVRVPLIMLLPQRSERSDVTGLVSLVDIAPTLLDLLGLPIPDAFAGHSLRPWFDQRDSGHIGGTVFTELIKEGTQRARPHERAVIQADRKLISDVDGKKEFYDLRTDPAETNAAALAEPARATLVETLTKFQEQGRPAPTRSAADTADPDTRERMRQLGYSE
jgi:arylsulfatase A-like enzyme